MNLYRPNPAFSSNMPKGPSKNALAVATLASLKSLWTQLDGWSWPHDLKIVEAACRGKSFAEIAADFRCDPQSIKARFEELKRAAIQTDDRYGIDAQERLLTALRKLATGEK